MAFLRTGFCAMSWGWRMAPAMMRCNATLLQASFDHLDAPR